MKDIDWLEKGTTYFPKLNSTNFTVIPASSVFYAMYKPEILKKYYGPEMIDYVTDFLCKNFRYKKELMENVKTKITPSDKPVTRDLSVEVSSSANKKLKYKVTLMNTLFSPLNEIPTRKDIVTEAENWRVLDYVCGCGRGTTVDQYCSLDYPNCAEWNIPYEEWDRTFKDETVSKFYGKVLCKHGATGLFETGRYRVFNMHEFIMMFPFMLRSLRYACKDGEKLSQMEMDVALNPIIQELGFGEIRDYIKKLYDQERELENHKERLVRILGRPERKILI